MLSCDDIISCMIFWTELWESFASGSPERAGVGMEMFGEFAEFIWPVDVKPLCWGLLDEEGVAE